jgi:hypothetical protein
MTFQFSFPAPNEPTWANLVDRWYQLDAYSYGLAEVYSRNPDQFGPHPDFVILASPRASNETDREFVLSGASSAGKFVHTLPNIRVSPLFQVMNYAGPVLCLQNDPHTYETALTEANYLLSEFKRIWVLAVEATHPKNSETRSYQVRYTVLTKATEKNS